MDVPWSLMEYLRFIGLILTNGGNSLSMILNWIGVKTFEEVGSIAVTGDDVIDSEEWLELTSAWLKNIEMLLLVFLFFRSLNDVWLLCHEHSLRTFKLVLHWDSLCVFCILMVNNVESWFWRIYWIEIRDVSRGPSKHVSYGWLLLSLFKRIVVWAKRGLEGVDWRSV